MVNLVKSVKSRLSPSPPLGPWKKVNSVESVNSSVCPGFPLGSRVIVNSVKSIYPTISPTPTLDPWKIINSVKSVNSRLFPFPPQYKLALCGHKQPLCGLTQIKSLLENNFQDPIFIKGSPFKTQTNTVWLRKTTRFMHHKSPLENNFQGPIFIRGSPSTIQTTTVCAHTTTVWTHLNIVCAPHYHYVRRYIHWGSHVFKGSLL